MRHLLPLDIPAALRRGKTVEQFVGRSPLGEGYIRHIDLYATNDGVHVWVLDKEDVGSEDWLDLYAFPYYDPDGPDEPVVFDDVDAALAFAAETLGCNSKRWVNQFVAQDEYLDFIRAGRPATWPVAD